MNHQNIKPYIGLGLAILAGIIFCAGMWTIVATHKVPTVQTHPVEMSRLDLIQLIQTCVFIITGVAVFWQLRQNAAQHQMDRLVAWKRSIQEVSHAIVQKPKLYVPLLYGSIEQKEGEELVATYACLHALETIYYMRKDEEVPPKELTKFIRAFVSGPSFHKLWGQADLRPAFTKEFQEQLNEILSP